MSKRNWQRSKCSVNLPRSEFLEIQPMMSGEGASSSGSGPQMTVETLSPISQLPSTSRNNSNEEPKEISVCDGSAHTLKGNTTAMRSAPHPRDPRLARLPSSEIGNKENKDHRKTGTIPKPKPDGMGQGWRGFSQDASLYKNQNIPMQPSKNSGDNDDSSDRPKEAIKKKGQEPTGKTLKRSHSSNFQLKEDNPSGAGNASLLNNPDFMIITENQPSQFDEQLSNLISDDLVFHQNLNNKIFVRTVMPKFLSNFQISSINHTSPKDPPISLKTQSIALQTNENQDNTLVVETLMPDAPILKPEQERPTRNPMWSSTFVGLNEKDNLPSTSKASKAVEKNVWHEDNLCEVSLREITNPEAPLTCVKSWRSIEAICMRLRGIDVPGNEGLLEETPTFEELFEVLSIEDRGQSVPKPKSNRKVSK